MSTLKSYKNNDDGNKQALMDLRERERVFQPKWSCPLNNMRMCDKGCVCYIAPKKCESADKTTVYVCDGYCNCYILFGHEA